jgi:hypothetical protein
MKVLDIFAVYVPFMPTSHAPLDRFAFSLARCPKSEAAADIALIVLGFSPTYQEELL